MVKGAKDFLFDLIMNTLAFILLVGILFALIFVLSASLSDPHMVVTGKVILFPRGFNLDAYASLLKQTDVWIGYRNTLLYTLIGTGINLFLTLFTAYPLSRKDFKGQLWITVLFMITMYFSGGMIPSFLLVKTLGIYDTLWALTLPGAVSVYNIIICRTYIQSSIPFDVQEAGKIDGCSDFGVFFRIILPLSGPIIAVLVMFFALAHWNDYFNALLYISSRNKYPLQLYLAEILVRNQQTNIDVMMSAEELVAAQRQADKAELLKYALVVVASLPFMVLYPLLQKYFVKGIMVGAIKG